MDDDFDIGDGFEGAAAGAATGSILPGIGTLVGGLAGAAGGLLGLVGSQNQNAANEQNQIQAEQFDEQMSSTAYQRTVADMKAAGINPMLAYMQGGASSPTAPTYTATNTLSDFASSAQDARDLVKKYQEAQGQDADNQVKTAAANVAEPSEQAGLADKQAKARSSQIAATIAANTQTAAQDTVNAQAAKATADAKTAKTDAEWANSDHWNKAINTGVGTARDAAEVIGIKKYLDLKKKIESVTKPDGNYKPDGYNPPLGSTGAKRDSTHFNNLNNSMLRR